MQERAQPGPRVSERSPNKMDEKQYSPIEGAFRIALETAVERLDDNSVCELRNQLRKYSDAFRRDEAAGLEIRPVSGLS
jgi:hypothetical protein